MKKKREETRLRNHDFELTTHFLRVTLLHVVFFPFFSFRGYGFLAKKSERGGHVFFSGTVVDTEYSSWLRVRGEYGRVLGICLGSPTSRQNMKNMKGGSGFIMLRVSRVALPYSRLPRYRCRRELRRKTSAGLTVCSGHKHVARIWNDVCWDRAVLMFPMLSAVSRNIPLLFRANISRSLHLINITFTGQ